MTILRTQDLVNFIKSEFGYDCYPNEFPRNRGATMVSALINSGGTTNRNISSPYIQFLVKANHPSEAEDVAFSIFQNLNYRTNFKIGNSEIIQCLSLNASPIYVGKVDETSFGYSLNFQITL